MAKKEENISSDKDSERNEKELEDKNILPPKIFSSHNSQSTNSQKEENTKNSEPSKSAIKDKSKSAKETDDGEDSTSKKEENASNGNSQKKQKYKETRFEDSVLNELKREFPSKTSGSKSKDEEVQDKGHEPAPENNEPKARARSNAIKEGSEEDAEIPEAPIEDIVVEKGGPSLGDTFMGKKGFVSSLLLDVISQEKVYPLQETKSKPISRQDLVEQKSTVMAVGSDIQDHFEKKGRSKSTAFMLSKKLAKSKSAVSGLHLKQAPESQTSLSTKSQKLPPELQHLKSGWKPADETEGGPHVGFRQRKQSWVGTYVDGTDYWTKMESTTEQEEVPLEMDQRGQTWYDLPVAEQVQIEIPQERNRTISRAKFDAVKMQSKQEMAESAQEEKKRLFSFDDREPIPEKINSDLYQMFLEFCKSEDLSAVQNRLSLLNADRSLEKVGLLDHKKLTMIHTGLCFKAAGGSKYRGLTFSQYRLFIEMVAETRKIPVFDFVNRLKLGYAGIIVLPKDEKSK